MVVVMVDIGVPVILAEAGAGGSELDGLDGIESDVSQRGAVRGHLGPVVAILGTDLDQGAPQKKLK